MPCPVNQRLVVGKAPQFSRPLIVGTGNAVFLTAICISLSGTTTALDLSIEEGNGLEQWTLVVSIPLIKFTAAPGFSVGVIAPLSSIAPPNNVAIGGRFVRVRLDATGSGPSAVADVILKTAQV